MNRNDTFFDPKAASYGTHDSEMLLGHHLKTNNITVRKLDTTGNQRKVFTAVRLGHERSPS